MSQLEERAVRRWSGRTIIRRSLIVGGVGITPLLLYLLFGPSDGNPIGLGLLAVATGPLALCGVGIGLIKFVVEALSRGR